MFKGHVTHIIPILMTLILFYFKTILFYCFLFLLFSHFCFDFSGPILESKGMHALKKGKKRFKKGKVFENFDKNVSNLKIFWKRAGDYMQLLHAINC